ncbi:MAG TPA: iron-containing alcohol dehydrogenase, partial [Acidimicrobiales bacterium]|nr:iron-containing alcohol dehydrogenase [Acidimicrobiales bacterium]
DDPTDVPARAAALTGALLGGRCLQNASVGIHHGLAQQVGARTGIPHGRANAVLLAHALRFNLPAIGAAGPRIGAALGDPDDPAGAVDRLRQRLGLPGSLAAAGVNRDDLDAVAMAAQDSPGVRANPRPAGPDEVRGVLEAAWAG